MKQRDRAHQRVISRRTALGGVLAGGVLLASGRAWAADAAEEEAEAPANPDAYIGVAPGSENKNPLPPAESDSPKLVWTGFQPSAEGGRVFLQTTLPVTYDVKSGGKQFSLMLRNCRIHLKNNERDLDTRFFDTPVAGVKARQRRKDVEVMISLKVPVEASPRVEEGPAGTKFVVLDFPAKG